MQKKFTIKLTKPVAGKRFGVFQHIMKWPGSEKVDVRTYQDGDNASHINWKLSAKYQTLYTNIFQQEKSLSLDMFLDINYNRRWGTIPNSQQVRAYAEDIISYCQHQQIAMRFFYPQRHFWRSPSLIATESSKNRNEMLDTLSRILSTVHTTKKIYHSLLATFLQQTLSQTSSSRPSTNRRAIVIFSDFLTMDKHTKKLLHYLKTQHILFLFQLPIDRNQGQNYTNFFLKKNITPASNSVWSDELQLISLD